MKLLYSNILPLETENSQQTVLDSFMEQATRADRIEIAVGYTSAASITELGSIAENCGIKTICLTIGMYYIEGMPEKIYHTAMKMNKKWSQTGIGEIRLVTPFKYHGKLYCFYKDAQPFAAIIGSANLSTIKPEASNRRQYEISALTTAPKEVSDIAKHIEQLKHSSCSANIAEIDRIPLIHETNTALNGIELVTSIPPSNVAFYEQCAPAVSFFLPLKVPASADRHVDDGRHFTRSNINVCYAAPRSKRKPRDWYETQLTVGAEIYRMNGYPEKNKPFFVVTDDGYWFKAHTTSDNNKQFSAVGDELIMGRWLKGRLAAAGIVIPVNNTAEDTDRKGMITQEMLDEYGCDRLLFKKTGQSALDSNGESLDVWFLAFIGSTD